jgi:hypothetical protein
MMTDQEADQRLVKVTAWYVMEREMPICVALQILQMELKDKRVFWESSKKLIKLIQDGICTY